MWIFILFCFCRLFQRKYWRKKTGVLRHLVCLLIDSDAVTSSVIYGSVYGLVVITVERYVKIVHPVAHRNHYRRWMTYVGVAIPWLIGLVTSSVPSITTAKFVNGTCTVQVYNTTLLFKSMQITLIKLSETNNLVV